MRVLGIDISKASITVCLLQSRPLNVREAFDHRSQLSFYTFHACSSDIHQLLNLFPDIAVLEPTGGNYSRLWISLLQETGCKICMIGHSELLSYRKSLGLPDKDDFADAISLACFWFDNNHLPRRFLSIREPAIASIRDCYYRLQFLARLRIPLINRIKQDLSWQFPEKAKYKVHRDFLSEPPLFWRWLANLSDWPKYDDEYLASIGRGIDWKTRELSDILCTIYYLESELEYELNLSLSQEIFRPYLEIFSEFGFGERTQAIILSQIYPFSKFLDPTGKVEIERSIGKISGKITKKNRSKRRFKKFMGCAPSRKWSGDRKTYVKSGPAIIRQALHLWILTRIAPANNRPKSLVCEKLGQALDKSKLNGQPTYEVWAKVRVEAVEQLFDRLVAKIVFRQL